MNLLDLTKNGPVARGATGQQVREIQRALVERAGAQLVVDGDYGRNTHMAVLRFQAAHDLPATGRFGPLTAALLETFPVLPPSKVEQPLPSVLGVAPWLSAARALTGTKEFKGGADNPIIVEWAGYVAEAYPKTAKNVLWYKHDSIAWCGLFVAYCVAKARFEPTEAPLYALNWGSPWTAGHKLAGPALGAIAVMERSGGGHVTFYEGEDDTHWFGRGGNQSDMVNVAKFPKSRPIRAWMWPDGSTLVGGGRLRTSFANAVVGTEA